MWNLGTAFLIESVKSKIFFIGDWIGIWTVVVKFSTLTVPFGSSSSAENSPSLLREPVWEGNLIRIDKLAIVHGHLLSFNVTDMIFDYFCLNMLNRSGCIHLTQFSLYAFTLAGTGKDF